MKTLFFEHEIQSPVIIGSGPLSYSADGMIALHQSGAGAVVTKTINRQAADNPYHHMMMCGTDTLINCEKWSDYSMQQWLDREIPRAVKAGVVCIASVGHTIEDAKLCVEQLEAEGCAAIELVSYDDATVLPMLEYTRKRVKIPVIVKLSPNSKDMLLHAKRCEEAGASGFTACDSMGPVLKIDIETGRPVLGGKGGYGWLTGAMIRPFTLQKICELRKITQLPIIGLGGIAKWQDAIEMVMAGADYIGICSAPIIKGVSFIKQLDQQVDGYLTQHGYESLKEISGIVHRYLPMSDDKRNYEMALDAGRCRKCRKCITVCPYHARSFQENGEMTVDASLCRRCGLCVSACSFGAIREIG